MKAKAFIVKHADRYYDDESPTMIYFMVSDIVARRAFAEEYNDGELGGINVKREPSLDRYENENKIPFWRLICMGWWTECDDCGKRISEDDLNDRGLDPTDVVGTFCSRTFCTPDCHTRWEAEQAERKHISGQAVYDLEKYLFKYFPGVTVTRTPSYVTHEQGKLVLDHAHIYFTFPEQNMGECRITEKHTVTVPRGAMTMFNEWRDTLNVDRPKSCD